MNCKNSDNTFKITQCYTHKLYQMRICWNEYQNVNVISICNLHDTALRFEKSVSQRVGGSMNQTPQTGDVYYYYWGFDVPKSFATDLLRYFYTQKDQNWFGRVLSCSVIDCICIYVNMKTRIKRFSARPSPLVFAISQICWLKLQAVPKSRNLQYKY